MRLRAIPVACAAVLVLLAILAIRLRRQDAIAPAVTVPRTEAWQLRPAAAGMIFTWNRSSAQLRDARQVDLILHNGPGLTKHSLDRPNGTLIIPYRPQAAVMTVDNRRILLYGSEPPQAASQPAVKPVRNPVARQQRLVLPMLLSNRGRKVIATAAVVLPRIPKYVQRPMEVQLSIKVAPQGTVANVTSDHYPDPLRNRLSAVAVDAISNWKFNRIAVLSYREAKVRVLFAPKAISVRAVRAR
jgi:hypothetical protein